MEEKYLDLHNHTFYSDGQYSPDDVIKEAIKKNVGVMAITDHDTLNGIKKVDRSKDFIVESGIEVIDGIELSAYVPKGRLHILGYGIDLNNEPLNNKLNELRDNSLHRVLSIMEQLKIDHGIFFSYDDIKELINSNHNLGRPDLAKLLIKYGYAKSVSDAFDKYLVDAFNKIRGRNNSVTYKECIELIKNSGGIAILAHPKSLELSEGEFLEVLREYISCGLDGIEVYHSSHSSEEIELYKRIAEEYNLLISGGSDFHGPLVKPEVELGYGVNNNLKIKSLSLYNHLHNR